MDYVKGIPNFITRTRGANWIFRRANGSGLHSGSYEWNYIN